jgi:hypothetical protein
MVVIFEHGGAGEVANPIRPLDVDWSCGSGRSRFAFLRRRTNLLSSRRVVSMLRWSVIRHGYRSKLVDCAVARCSSGQAVGEEVGVKRIDGFEEFAARLLGANPGNPASDGTSD